MTKINSIKKYKLLIELIKLFLFVLIVSTLSNCSKNENFYLNKQASIRDSFLVDKIYNYHNILLAEYHYNNENKLSQRIIADTLIESHRIIYRKTTENFEYNSKGLVTKIVAINNYYDNSQSSGRLDNSKRETIFEYDSRDRLVNFEYDSGRVVSFKDKNKNHFNYSSSGNIVNYIYTDDVRNMIGEPTGETIEVSLSYEYDDKFKPNFGIDQLPLFCGFPLTGSAGWLKRELSQNNITKDGSSGTEWIYTYNKNGLPETMETKWNGVNPTEPMLNRIIYKRIK